jgi:hypothetical protein
MKKTILCSYLRCKVFAYRCIIAFDLSPTQIILIFRSAGFSFISNLTIRAIFECTAPHNPRSLVIKIIKCSGFFCVFSDNSKFEYKPKTVLFFEYKLSKIFRKLTLSSFAVRSSSFQFAFGSRVFSRGDHLHTFGNFLNILHRF